jgi:hypothetical protein
MMELAHIVDKVVLEGLGKGDSILLRQLPVQQRLPPLRGRGGRVGEGGAFKSLRQRTR